MIIDCISDLHGSYPTLEGGDLLIVAGDLTAIDTPVQHLDFIEWLKNQYYKKKIVIAGNHDGFIEKLKNPYFHHIQTLVDGMEYLCDSGAEFEGFKIWGSPWTPWFSGVHPKCKAFMKNRGNRIKAKWNLIPDDVDILVTHGPAFGIQDECKGKLLGCEELRSTIDHRLKKLKLHVFGHIHEGYGKVVVNGVMHVNASIMNEDYDPVNKPIRVELLQKNCRF